MKPRDQVRNFVVASAINCAFICYMVSDREGNEGCSCLSIRQLKESPDDYKLKFHRFHISLSADTQATIRMSAWVNDLWRGWQ